MRAVSSPEVVDILEQQLKMSLRKIEPNPDFVTHLHTRLTDPSPMSIEQRQSIGFGLLLFAASLLSGVFLILLLRQNHPVGETR
jgi:hypothetical protein